MTTRWIDEPIEVVLANLNESHDRLSGSKLSFAERSAERDKWPEYTIDALLPTQGHGGEGGETVDVPTSVTLTVGTGYRRAISVEVTQGPLRVSGHIERDTRLFEIVFTPGRVYHENGAPPLDVRWKPVPLSRTLPVMAALAPQIRPVMEAAYRAWLRERDAARAKRLTPGQAHAMVHVLETGVAPTKGTKVRVVEHLLTCDYLTVPGKWARPTHGGFACTVNDAGRAALRERDPDTDFAAMEATRVRVTAERAVQHDAERNPAWSRAREARERAAVELSRRLGAYSDAARDLATGDDQLADAHHLVVDAREALRGAVDTAALAWATAWGEACAKHVPKELADPVCPATPSGGKW